MAGKRVEAVVTPELLRWSRESIGLSVEQMAKKVGTTEERVEDWEAGRRRPSLAQARKWANAAKRPLVIRLSAKASP